MVRRLIKHPAETMSQMTPEKCGLVHAVFGVIGEAGEIDEAMVAFVTSGGKDKENLVEETGDMLFFLKDAFSYVSEDDFLTALAGYECDGNHNVASRCSALTDIAKKFVIYNQEFTEERRAAFRYNLLAIGHDLSEMCQGTGITFDEAMSHNLNKLEGKNGRYSKEGYSDLAAAERVDKLMEMYESIPEGNVGSSPTNADDDLDEPLPPKQCNLDDGECESCQ